MIDETREPQPNTDSRGRRRNRNRRKKGRGARWWKKQSRNLQIPISRSCVIPFFYILERDSGLGSLAWTPATRHFEKLRRRSKRRQDNKWFGIISMLLCLHFVDGPVDASISSCFLARTFSNINDIFFLIENFDPPQFFLWIDFWNNILVPNIRLVRF